MFTITIVQETKVSKETISIKDIKGEDINLSVVELAGKYGINVSVKTEDAGATVVRKFKQDKDEAKKTIISVVSS